MWMPQDLKRVELNNDYNYVRALKLSKKRQVYLVRHKITGHQYVVEMHQKYKCDKQRVNKLIQYAAVAQSIDHPNIVKYLQVHNYVDTCCFLAEYVEGKDLSSYLKLHEDILSLDEVKRMYKQILTAVNYLHERNIFHGNLSLEEFRFDSSGKVKLINIMSLSPPREEEAYCPLKSVEISKVNTSNSHHGDVWALGIILHALVTGVLIKNKEALLRVLRDLAKGRPPIHAREGCLSLLREMLNFEPSLRPRVAHLLCDEFLTTKEAVDADYKPPSGSYLTIPTTDHYFREICKRAPVAIQKKKLTRGVSTGKMNELVRTTLTVFNEGRELFLEVPLIREEAEAKLKSFLLRLEVVYEIDDDKQWICKHYDQYADEITSFRIKTLPLRKETEYFCFVIFVFNEGRMETFNAILKSVRRKIDQLDRRNSSQSKCTEISSIDPTNSNIHKNKQHAAKR